MSLGIDETEKEKEEEKEEYQLQNINSHHLLKSVRMRSPPSISLFTSSLQSVNRLTSNTSHSLFSAFRESRDSSQGAFCKPRWATYCDAWCGHKHNRRAIFYILVTIHTMENWNKRQVSSLVQFFNFSISLLFFLSLLHSLLTPYYHPEWSRKSSHSRNILCFVWNTLFPIFHREEMPRL